MTPMQRYRAAKYQARLKELDEAVLNRPVLPDTELAWAAGMFEGEGTATITRSTSHTRGLLTLTNTDRQIVEFFNERWPGCIRNVRPKKAQHRHAWAWTLTNSLQMLMFIADIKPFVRTTRVTERLNLLAETQRIRRQGSKDQRLKARLEEAREQMAKLNRRGIAPQLADAFALKKMPPLLGDGK